LFYVGHNIAEIIHIKVILIKF